jgi:hypothetical protein
MLELERVTAESAFRTSEEIVKVELNGSMHDAVDECEIVMQATKFK